MSYQIGDLRYNVSVMRDGKLSTFNIFDHVGVRLAICRYKLHPEDVHTNLCSFLFGDFWARAEFEMTVSDLLRPKKQMKIDVYRLFIEPNFPLLKEMVDEVSVNSCKEWFRGYKNGR